MLCAIMLSLLEQVRKAIELIMFLGDLKIDIDLFVLERL